jgi:hypothetical protein
MPEQAQLKLTHLSLQSLEYDKYNLDLPYLLVLLAAPCS